MAGSSKKELDGCAVESRGVGVFSPAGIRGRKRISLWGGAYIFVIEADFAKEAGVYNRAGEPVPI